MIKLKKVAALLINMADFFAARPYILYFCLSFAGLLSVYLIRVIIYYLRFKKIKLANFGFSLLNYHITVSGFLLGIILLTFIAKDYFYFILFILFSLAGVIGEIIFSIWWKIFFKKPFWRYLAYPTANKFSSWFNFTFWGVGGFLFLALTQAYYKEIDFVFKNDLDRLKIFTIGAWLLFLLFSQVLIFKTIRKTLLFNKFKKINERTRFVLKYIFFVSPLFLLGVFIPLDYFNYLLLFFSYGIFAFAAEYLSGRISRLIIGKQLWVYNYMAFDDNHTTFLNIIPFGLAGYYFLFLFFLINPF